MKEKKRYRVEYHKKGNPKDTSYMVTKSYSYKQVKSYYRIRFPGIIVDKVKELK